MSKWLLKSEPRSHAVTSGLRLKNKSFPDQPRRILPLVGIAPLREGQAVPADEARNDDPV
jgi:hypothetical protein